jgi:hypothetical protein
MNEYRKQEVISNAKFIILAFLSIVFIMIAIGFGSGYIQALYNRTVGVEIESSKRDIYKENKSHVEGMIKDLSNYKMQYEKSDSEKEKKAIQSRIVNDFANFDTNKIDNTSLQLFLEKMRGV